MKKLKPWHRLVIGVVLCLTVFAIGVYLEPKRADLLPEILQSIGGVSVVLYVGYWAYTNYFK